MDWPTSLLEINLNAELNTINEIAMNIGYDTKLINKIAPINDKNALCNVYPFIKVPNFKLHRLTHFTRPRNTFY